MAIDPGLYARAQKAVGAKTRKHVTAEMLVAVVMQESGQSPIFIDTKPGGLCAANIKMAVEYYKYKKDPATGKKIRIGPFKTGFTEADVKRMMTIPERVGSFQTPKELAGKLCKFRFERGYWEKKAYAHLEPEHRFYMSCSYGLTQHMAMNITRDLSMEAIKRFMADIDLQLLYGAGTLDSLLTRANGNLLRAYKGYNSGNIDSDNADVIARAGNVVAHHKQVLAWVKTRGGK